MSHDISPPPVDPQVVRRTLTIAGTFFGVGILLATLWVYKEVRRVRTMERLDAPVSDVSGAGKARSPGPTNSTP